MSCHICGDNNKKIIIDKKTILIWTGCDESTVYQKMELTLNDFLFSYLINKIAL